MPMYTFRVVFKLVGGKCLFIIKITSYLLPVNSYKLAFCLIFLDSLVFKKSYNYMPLHPFQFQPIPKSKTNDTSAINFYFYLIFWTIYFLGGIFFPFSLLLLLVIIHTYTSTYFIKKTRSINRSLDPQNYIYIFHYLFLLSAYICHP